MIPHNSKAFLRQLNIWQSSLRSHLSTINNLLPSLEKEYFSLAQSLIIDIEAQLFRYGKQRDRVQSQTGDDQQLTLQHYEMYAKRYFYLQKQIEKLTQQSVSFSLNKSTSRKKGYLNDTYLSKKNQTKQRIPSAKPRYSNKFAQSFQPQWISELIGKYSRDKTTLKGNKDLIPKADKQLQPFRHGQMRQLSLQLVELKRLVVDLKERLENHSHPQYQEQIQELKESNRKLFSELSLLREQNNNLLIRVQDERKGVR